MVSAKELSVKVIPASIANPFVKRNHYSGKVVPNSKLHFGVFIEGKLHGVMSFGPPMDKSKVLGLVVDANGNPAPWNDMLELNRMAFDDVLPKNSESRAIAVAVRLIRKYAPNIKWILSFADGCQCGDGAIYRASGFALTQVKKNTTIKSDGNGKLIADMTVTAHRPGDIADFRKNYKPIPGFMLRYIKIIDKGYHLSVPELPYSTIQEKGAKMYRGEKR
jgi:hypothetical protein